MNLSREWRAFRDVDWRDLDLKEAGRWPGMLHLLCCFVSVVLVMVVMGWYLVLPTRQAWLDAQQREESLLLDYRQEIAQAAMVPGLRNRIAELEARSETLKAMLPDEEEIPAVVDAINDIARDNQLAVDFIRLRAPVREPFYTESGFDIQVRGDYHRIAAFLSGVANMSFLVTQHDFTLAPVDSGSNELRLSMLVRTYSDRWDTDVKASRGER